MFVASKIASDSAINSVSQSVTHYAILADKIAGMRPRKKFCLGLGARASGFSLIILQVLGLMGAREFLGSGFGAQCSGFFGAFQGLHFQWKNLINCYKL